MSGFSRTANLRGPQQRVGKLLEKLDQLGIVDNTIVMYSTDNGAEVMS
jgi:arylsulfatase A-like enzyme